MKKLREAHQEFVDHLKSKKRASATVLAYGKDIEQLVQFLEELQKAHVQEVTSDDIKGFLAKMDKDGYTQKSISRKSLAAAEILICWSTISNGSCLRQKESGHQQ